MERVWELKKNKKIAPCISAGGIIDA